MWHKIEESWGGAITYATAAANVGVGSWIGNHWFAVLSAAAIIIRMAVDLKAFFRKDK